MPLDNVKEQNKQTIINVSGVSGGICMPNINIPGIVNEDHKSLFKDN